jgi:hypothetical protein
MALEDATNPMQGVSGPGRFAKRTDLQYQPTEYGAGVQYDAQKAGAPLAKTPDVPGATNTEVRQAAMAATQTPLTSLYAPTNRPDEPITHGVDVGPGAGSNVLNMPNQTDSQYTTAYDLINQLASNPDASPTLQYLAQRIQQGF